MTATTLPRLRQIVLITGDLDAATAHARHLFGFTDGIRDEESMAALGFEHEVFTFGDTFLEIVAPLSADSPHGRMVAAHGDSGYMVDVQVADLDGLVERARVAGITPVLDQEFQGHRITQWHPRELGTLAEFDQVEPVHTWHFAPRIFRARSTAVVRDIAGATLAVPDPKVMAIRWSHVLGSPRIGTTVPLSCQERLSFVACGSGRAGLRVVDVLAADPAAVGESVDLCGVSFRFVADQGKGA